MVISSPAVRGVLLALLTLATGCGAFEPVVLDFKVPMPQLVEVGGLVATDDGFQVAGLVANGEMSRDFAVLPISDAGQMGALATYRRSNRDQGQVNGMLALPGGGWLVHGYGWEGERGIRLDAAGKAIWSGLLGGNFGRASALGTGGSRFAVVGSAYAGDGTGRQVFWAGVFELQAKDVVLVGQDTWTPEEAGRGASARTVAPAADGGFLVGGSFDGPSGDYPVILRLGADGHLDPTNLHPKRADRGRAAALLALSDGRYALAGEFQEQGVFGLFDPDDPQAWDPALFCAGGVKPTRPVSMALANGQVRIAGWAGWSDHTVWMYATDLQGVPGLMHTYGNATYSGADRIRVAFSAAGGVALTGTLCVSTDAEDCMQLDTAVPASTLWHMDEVGSGFGTVVNTECF